MKVFRDIYEPSPSVIVLGLLLCVMVAAAVLVAAVMLFPRTAAALCALALVSVKLSGGRRW